jgi:hypothetical protein
MGRSRASPSSASFAYALILTPAFPSERFIDVIRLCPQIEALRVTTYSSPRHFKQAIAHAALSYRLRSLSFFEQNNTRLEALSAAVEGGVG